MNRYETAIEELSVLEGNMELPSLESIEVAIESLKKAEKYKLHDLRKNPSDLPKENTNVLVLGATGEYSTARYYKCWMNDWVIDNPYVANVIAWKYIEPFEEVEE